MNNTSTRRITTRARTIQTLRKRRIVQAMRNQWTWTMDHRIMEEEDIQIIIHMVHLLTILKGDLIEEVQMDHLGVGMKRITNTKDPMIK